MRRVLLWVAVVVLCCAASATAGEQQPDVRLQRAQQAFDEATALDKAGKYSEAIAQIEQALALREAVFGGSHPEVVDCLNLLGRLHRRLGDFDRAEPLIQRGLAIREAALGKNHPDVAASLNNLANLYYFQGAYERAEPLQQRGLAIREAALGPNHPDVAQSLNDLAKLYKQQGLYERAESLHERALAIREAALGPNHPDVAQSLNNLALVYLRHGLHGRVEPLLQRALAIWETALGKHHPFVADALHNLASLYLDLGWPSRAEPLLERTIAISEVALGKNHPDVADSLNNLGILYKEQGLYGRAESLYARVLDIREAALGKHHPSVADSLNNLAIVYVEQGLYGRAEPLYERALAIKEAALGKHHPTVADSLDNLAILYVKQGLYERAEPLHERALAIREAALVKHHAVIAESLTNLGNLDWEQGRYARAEPRYERALAILEAIFGKQHHNLAPSLNNLALLRLAQHRLGAAVALFTRSFTGSERRLRDEALGFSEARLASFLQLLRSDEQRLYALLRAHPDSARVRRLALSAALLLKGRSLEETTDISRAVYRSLGPEERDTFERLLGLRTQRARLSLQGPGSLPPAAYQRQLRELAEQGDALEASLARRSAPLRALAALPPPAQIVARVAKALPRDGALIEFVTYADRPLVPKPGTPQARLREQLRYLALVLMPDTTIRALDLGPAEPIDAAATRLRDMLANRDAAFQSHAQALYQLAFQPLLPLLGKTRRLFLAPDGQLALVPFAVLHDGHQFLVETFDFSYLTSGKDLLPRAQQAVPMASVVVLADPDFGAALPAPAPSTGVASAQAQRSTSRERFFSALSEEPAQRAWAPVSLPGTRHEAEAIQRLLPQAQLFLGPAATKERLLNLPPPGILHLATHGFFLKDAAALPRSRGVGHFGALGEDPQASSLPDPLLRSGLLFAGAGARPPANAGTPQLPPESALATALELAGLNLWGTQLVVLSACDTGRGDVNLGQGVYGLRRAFVVAGAETVVMSLWKVDDETTSTLMEAYYRNLLAGQGRASALSEAMRWLRGTQPHPHSWAPFIVLGRDAPLRELGLNALEPSKR
jgi:CHAT domain-containing protein/Tfp pilus assembly protein PilF